MYPECCRSTALRALRGAYGVRAPYAVCEEHVARVAAFSVSRHSSYWLLLCSRCATEPSAVQYIEGDFFYFTYTHERVVENSEKFYFFIYAHVRLRAHVCERFTCIDWRQP